MSDGNDKPIKGMTPEQQKSFEQFIKKESTHSRIGDGDLNLGQSSDPGNEAALERLKNDLEYYQDLESKNQQYQETISKIKESFRKGNLSSS